MGRGPWGQAPSKRKAVAMGALVLLTLLIAAPPLGATCSCSISATVTEPDLTLFGRSSGVCEWWARISFSGPGLYTPYASAERFGTSCSLTYPTYSACLRAGLHTATAHCDCGKSFPGADGTSYCGADPDRGTAETTFFVNTTPTVGVSYSGPDVEGNGTLALPYSFPNTIYGDPHRRLTVYADGIWLAETYGEQVSGTWTRAQGTACWSQGSHEIKAVAVACGQSGDAAYQAEAVTTVEVDHQPEVSVSVTPLDPADPGSLQVAAVAFSFPQTVYDVQRLLTLRAIPSGYLVGAIRPYARQGTWRPGVSCSNGANAWVAAVAEACGDTQAKAVAALPLCPRPPRKDGCGRAGNQCCLAGGSGAGGGGPGFGDKSGPPSEGPGARLRYLAGGAGSPGNPGQADWNAILGRGWSHDYAERIVPAAGGRAWLITRYGNFREFTDANNDGLYEKVSPEDEYLTLTKTAAGWALRDLDGTVALFDSAGLWVSTTDRNGNAKTATYTGGRLREVAMPDGRRERFQYHASGKLAAIVEVGAGGVEERTWNLTWEGNDLVSIEAPDGTGQRFVYGDGRNPGSMTRRLLLGTDDGDPATARPERVDSAWEYDGLGNVVKTWRGSPDFATGAERHEFAYDNPIEPARTTLTIHRSETEREVVVYTLSRTATGVGAKARITSISGDCSSCGLAPNSQLFYDDPAHPLLPTRMLDGRGTETRLRYDAHGRVIERTEAAGTPLSHTTTWTYDAAFPALPTRIEAPSTAGGAARRATVMTYDAVGNLTSRRVQGVEAGNRVLQDGALDYRYDANGNPTSLIYPGGVEAMTTYDYADRPATLLARHAGQPDQPLVTTASYLPSGPLSSLTLGNGLTEARSFTNRYFPSSIVAGSHLSWSYSTDAVGNTLSIADTLSAGNNRSYAYQDHQYFLTLGNGPWGPRAWTYDKIGNRLTETRGTVTDTYSYLLNGTGGNTPQIDQIVPGSGPTALYSYDEVGNLLSNGMLPFSYGTDRRMSRTGTAGSGTTSVYDGRGFLSRSALSSDFTVPTYSSAGLLQHRFTHQASNQAGLERDSDLYVFYFAGRPVATLDNVTGGSTATSTWQYLTVDHLGTPILVTDPAGIQLWQGGFEPFGTDYGSSPSTLRFPGQWSDATWNGSQDVRLYYNVHRWYEAGSGRYTQPDPLNLGTLAGGLVPWEYALRQRDLRAQSSIRMRSPQWEHGYGYVSGRPINFADPKGLFGPGGLAGTGGAICLLDSPVPGPADVVGGALILIAGTWATANWIDDLLDKPKPCNDCEETARCKKVKLSCIEKCSDEELPTWPPTDQGLPFFNCLKNCMTDHGCTGY